MKLTNKHSRIVIKIGSGVLSNQKGQIRTQVIQEIANDIASINKNRKLIIVSSGAIAMGRKLINMHGDINLSESQALAAVGQIELMRSWKSAFQKHNIDIAQILLTPKEIQTRKDANTAIKTINTLHDHKVIPVVNENDTTATDEIQFGDNDLLSARLAKLFRADLLIMLSTVDGLHESFLNNGNLSQASLLKSVNKITPTIKKMAGRASQLGKGGMISKIEAAQLILGMNSELVITRGDTPDPITKLRRNSLSTWFKK